MRNDLRADLRAEYVRLVRAARLRRIGKQVLQFGVVALVAVALIRAAV